MVQTDPDRLHPGFAQAYLFETADGYANIFPKTYADYWAYATRNADAKSPAATQYQGNRLHLNLPYSAQAWLARPDEEREAFSELFDLNLLSVANVRYILSSVPLRDQALELIESPPTIEPGGIEPGFVSALLGFLRGKQPPSRRVYVYQNRMVLPRCYVVGKTTAAATQSAVLKGMSEVNAQELGSQVFVLESEVGQANQPAGPRLAQLRIETYTSDLVEAETELSSTGYAIMAIDFNSYWQVEIDGIRAKVLLANGTFMGVEVPGGKHRLTWRYSPPWRLLN